ncbi:MAG: nucleotidyltransferase family protein [Candidatus Nezhaarchaeota archaeon]|nr:nucleotidyltransferase family protein [Candidatus Nezhaarchaeota archaeon]MCX8141567.1 nucleotidyltransferase family protein [Candidatus Nezhaarchaeota archaeon]MDW8049834.1 nucleotidyltransferase family protein [Nitrososphaerota archaeon]
MGKVKAVILAGGLGTRLRPLTYIIPKPMLPLGDKPILERIIVDLRDQGIKDIVISCSYLARVIESYFGDGSWLGVNISYVKTERPLGTAGQLKPVREHVNGTFITIYGDVYAKMNYMDLLRYHKAVNATATMVLRKVEHIIRFGVIAFDDQGRVFDWHEKPKIEFRVNAGIYVFEPKVFDYILDGIDSMDRVFKEMIKRGERVYSYGFDGEIYDIGDMISYEEAVKKFTEELGKV